MYLSVPDSSAPTPVQPSGSPIDEITRGFMSSIGAGIEDWSQPFAHLARVYDQGDAGGPLTKDDYDKLPFAVPGGWYPGITTTQALVSAGKYDQDQKAAAYAGMHPIKAIAGNVVGESLNPLWWVGAGELAEVGPILGRIGGDTALGKLAEAGVAQGIQAAGVTAAEEGAKAVTGEESDPWTIIQNFAGGMVLGTAAHGIHLALRPQVAALQDIQDSVEGGKPLDAANKVLPESPENAPEGIPAETITMEGDQQTVADISATTDHPAGETVSGEALSRIEQEKASNTSYVMVGKDGRVYPIASTVDAVDTHPAADQIKVKIQGASHSLEERGENIKRQEVTGILARAVGNIAKYRKDIAPSSRPSINTMPVGGPKPVVQAAEQAAKDQQTVAEEIAQKPAETATEGTTPVAATGGGAVEKTSPAPAEAATPQFPFGIQEGYEADLADSNKMKVMADALKQALGCRLNG